MGLRGNVGALKSIGQTIRKLPVSVAHDVAQRAAPALTALTRADFDAGQSVYGDPRPRSKVDGHVLTLTRTGATKADLRFVANGTIIRCVLGTKWARYLIGKYGILPSGALPAAYKRALDGVVATAKAPGAP
jgi:hypothetical protein